MAGGSNRRVNLRAALPLGLLACAAIALLVLLIILLPPEPIAAMAAPLGVALICLLPGYLLISAIFPRKDDLSGRGRLLLSLGADLLLAVLMGLVLSFTPRGLHLASFAVVLSFLTLFFAVAAYVRWLKQPRRRRLAFDCSFSLRPIHLTGRSRSRKRGQMLAMLIVLIGAIVVSALAYGIINNRITTNSTGANESLQHGLTEFYVLWPGGGNGHLATVVVGSSSAGIAGIVNREDGPVNYTLQLALNNSTVLRKEIRLERNESWEGPLSYIFEAPGIKSADVLLYRDENFEQPYREDHLVINVSANDSVNSTLNKGDANLGQKARVMAVAMGGGDGGSNGGGSNSHSYGSAASSYVEPSLVEEIPPEEMTKVEQAEPEAADGNNSSLKASAASPDETGSASVGMQNIEENVTGSSAQNATSAVLINESKNISFRPANKSLLAGANFASATPQLPGLNNSTTEGTGRLNNTTCDDGDPCTTGDFYSGDRCSGIPINCEDRNACTNDTCEPSTGQCNHTRISCDDGNPCTDDSCNLFSGCENTPRSGSCDDGNACTATDTCSEGRCLGRPVNCDDGNVCTNDSCDPFKGCVNMPHSGSCDDGNACTTGDTCSGGDCSGKPLSCDDGNVCTDDSCDPFKGCMNPPNAQSCDDGDASTMNDTCMGGICSGQPKDCDDHNPCTSDHLDSAAGCLHTPLVDGAACTSDANTCTDDVCSGGKCTHARKSCDDGNVCTDDSCDPIAGCVNAHNSGSCDDSDPCTINDTCSEGVCSGQPCDDHNSCTTDACDSVAGCVYTPMADGATCTSDGNACTDDVCSSGKCTHAQKSCDDGNVCTDDSCDPLKGCVNTPNSGSCDDGNACTTGDICSGGDCSGKPLSCDDGNVCTDDSCDPFKGCVNPPNAQSCDDGDASTMNDTCMGGICSGQPKDCDDHNPCTSDRPDSTAGCLHTPLVDGAACTSDKNTCTDDVCLRGTCTHKQKSCDDGNVCTDDSCDRISGCVNMPNTGSCDDGDACTTGDLCSGGSCSGRPVSCDDGNVCTIDSCNPSKGCVNAAAAGSCDDGNPCTTNDTCSGGSCSGQLRDCDDHNSCTADTCDSAGDCIYAPLGNGTACTSDGNSCTDDICSRGICAHLQTSCDDGDPMTADSCDPAKGCVHASEIDQWVKSRSIGASNDEQNFTSENIRYIKGQADRVVVGKGASSPAAGQSTRGIRVG
jgi:uncharacterized membrane protein